MEGKTDSELIEEREKYYRKRKLTDETTGLTPWPNNMSETQWRKELAKEAMKVIKIAPSSQSRKDDYRDISKLAYLLADTMIEEGKKHE